MREIVLDTETTGLDPYAGHRLVEIGCIELVNRMPTGRHFHRYLNPDRDMPAEAFAVHGLSSEFLQDKPHFGDIADELLDFVLEAPLVAHNAGFDLGFLNAELERAGRKTLERERLVDTLLLARRKHPAGPNRLDDLCARYGIDNSRRTRHGALLDAEILADVYLDLIGARQAQLILVNAGAAASSVLGGGSPVRLRPMPLVARLSSEEAQAHRSFVCALGDGAIWLDYPAGDPSAEGARRQLMISPQKEVEMRPAPSSGGANSIQPQVAA
jgi:DNA polymerase III subunit epsilon